LASPGYLVLRCTQAAKPQNQGNNPSDFLGWPDSGFETEL
jgi:hypothetical protein